MTNITNKNINLAWFGAGQIASEFTRLYQNVDFGTLLGFRRNTTNIPGGMTGRRADFSSEACLTGCELEAVKLSHIVVTLTPPERSDSGYKAGYVDASRNLIAELKRLQQSPQAVLFVSSTSVYGQDQGQWLDEASLAEPEHFAGKRLLQAEALWRNSGWPVCCVRFSGIYGPGRYRMLDQIRLGKSSPNSAGGYTNRIHQTDCARVIKHLLTLEGLPDVLIGTDSGSVPMGEFKSWLAGQMGVDWRSEKSTGPVFGKRLSNRRLLDTGFTLQYPGYQDGYPAIVVQYLKDQAL